MDPLFAYLVQNDVALFEKSLNFFDLEGLLETHLLTEKGKCDLCMLIKMARGAVEPAFQGKLNSFNERIKMANL